MLSVLLCTNMVRFRIAYYLLVVPLKSVIGAIHRVAATLGLENKRVEDTRASYSSTTASQSKWNSKAMLAFLGLFYAFSGAEVNCNEQYRKQFG